MAVSLLINKYTIEEPPWTYQVPLWISVARTHIVVVRIIGTPGKYLKENMFKECCFSDSSLK